MAVVVVPSMVRAGVPIATEAADGIPYGSTQEVAILEEFFRLAVDRQVSRIARFGKRSLRSSGVTRSTLDGRSSAYGRTA